jgi:hypothetical protein
MWVGGQLHAPAALPPGMTRYPLYRRLGRPQGRSGQLPLTARQKYMRQCSVFMGFMGHFIFGAIPAEAVMLHYCQSERGLYLERPNILFVFDRQVTDAKEQSLHVCLSVIHLTHQKLVHTVN